jgi:hypothetical protein
VASNQAPPLDTIRPLPILITYISKNYPYCPIFFFIFQMDALQYVFPTTLGSLYPICHYPNNTRSRGSSVSIVSDYRLDDRAIEVRSPTGADFSSSLCVHTGSEAHQASYPMGTGGSFPGGKARLGRDADHSPPSSVEVKNE